MRHPTKEQLKRIRISRYASFVAFFAFGFSFHKNDEIYQEWAEPWKYAIKLWFGNMILTFNFVRRSHGGV